MGSRPVSSPSCWGIGVVVAPLDLGHLAVKARRTTGSWSPLAAVDDRAKMPRRRVALLGGGFAVWMLAFVVAHMLFLDRLIAPLFSWMPATLFQFSTVETGGDPLLGGALTVMIAAAFVSPGCRGRRSIAVSLVAHVTVNVVFTLLIIAAYLEAAA